MPDQDSHDDDARPELRPSRRRLLITAAGAGAVGVAAAAGITATVTSSSHSQQDAATTAAAGSGPIVVYLRDASSGVIEIFSGTSQTRRTDRNLAAMVASIAPR